VIPDKEATQIEHYFISKSTKRTECYYLALSISNLSSSQREDLRLASSKLSGVKRRYFQAEMAIKYCQGNTRLTKRIFGWS
jgi:hypothetical protein